MMTNKILLRPQHGIVLMMLLTVTMSTQLLAQLEDDKYYYGFKAGPVFSIIDDIRTTIIPGSFSQDSYTAESSRRTGFTVGAFVNHRFKDSEVSLQPHLYYTMSGGDFKYTDVQDLQYQMEFRYQYINLGLMVKWYAFGGLGFAIGPDIGFNIQKSNIFYSSNMPELGPDLQIQQSLREVLKGQTDAGLLMGIGYDFEFGLSLDARYRLGFSDAIATQSNGFNFVENDNWSGSFQILLGYAIPFYN
jgi:hypothetical protein